MFVPKEIGQGAWFVVLCYLVLQGALGAREVYFTDDSIYDVMSLTLTFEPTYKNI
jgi:hypothetical protein